MLAKIWRWFTFIPKLVAAATILQADVQVELKDDAVAGAWLRFTADPAIAPLLPRFSAEWRAVEQAIDRLR